MLRIRVRPGRSVDLHQRQKLDKKRRELVHPTLKQPKRNRKWDFYRRNKDYVDKLFNRPFTFRTSDGKKVQVLRHGISDTYYHPERQGYRPLVGVIVNGKRIFFYRSTGANSNQPFQWFPTTGMKIGKENQPLLIKLKGHPALWKQEKPINEEERRKDEEANRLIEQSETMEDFNDQLRTFMMGAEMKLAVKHVQLITKIKPTFPRWVKEVQRVIGFLTAKPGPNKVQFELVNRQKVVNHFFAAVNLFPGMERPNKGRPILFHLNETTKLIKNLDELHK